LFKDYPLRTMYMGVANVVANGLVMLRYVLWSASDVVRNVVC
jgi:hypothetical protein